MSEFHAGQTVEISYGDRSVTFEVPANWPPYDGDVWADRDDKQYIAYVHDLGDDTAVCGFLAMDADRRVLPDYLLEVAGPLRLVAAGWDRNRQAVTA